ncbi:complement C3-like, partial [Hippocampus zosterae]|uniref:complement C3-like n=1 Tax=Hippocampus zosterae TaxID=109293 RepID=UPI00223E86DF
LFFSIPQPITIPEPPPAPVEVPRFTLVAPDLLRTDSPENIFLQAEGIASPVEVIISVTDFTKTTMLFTDGVTLNPGNDFHTLKSLQIPSSPLNRDEIKNKYVIVKVKFGNYHEEERTVMVSFHSGYIFIQTDKPIYNPGDEVRLRAFVSSLSFKASDSSLTVDIQNPEGVVVKQVLRTKASSGVFSDSFYLTEMANEGTWKVIAKFDHWKQNTFTSHFEVKKYVLPAFNVTLTPKKSFLSLDDKELEVEIWARYLYGEPVQGTAYVSFGVNVNKEMRRLPSVKQVSNLEGGVVKLTVDELKAAYPNVKTLVGNSIYVKASVLTKTGADLVEAEKTGIKIVDSPYVLSFKNMVKYFKPGLPFDFTIQVSHHDGSPARNVPVKVNHLPEPVIVSLGTARVTANMPKMHMLALTAETQQADLRPEQQAKVSTFLFPYLTFSRQTPNYLYISSSTNTASPGDTLAFKLTIDAADQHIRQHIKHLTYLVVNKGRLVEARRLDVSGQLVTSVGLVVTPDLMPSFRLVAFYSLPSQEVVADSVWVDVASSCVGDLSVNGEQRDYTPGKNLQLRVRGDPGASVSLVAVDNAVFLLKRDRLTQSKLWDTVEQGDLGCTRGGGINAKKLFQNAGLLYSSSTGFRTETRDALHCPVSNRRRRSSELLQKKAQLESRYKEKLAHRCCSDGLRAVRMPYSCTRRSLYITEGWECIRAFRYCCASYRDEVLDMEMPATAPPTTAQPTTTAAPRTVPTRIHLGREMFNWGGRTGDVVAYSNAHRTLDSPKLFARGPVMPREEARPVTPEVLGEYVELDDYEDDEDEYLEERDVYLRFRFFESWLWTEVKLPDEADRDGLASTQLSQPLPDSITEWGVIAVSSSPNTGFCVAEPYNIKAWKRFFVDLKLPYSVARNEQVEIKAVIHNYGDDELHVRVVLMKTENMCSVAFRDRHTQEVTLPAGTSKAVAYTIMPLAVGRLPIEVMVVARDMLGGDRIQKLLRVVMDGVQKTKVWSAVLNPAAEGGKQSIQVGKVELEGVVPNSTPETFINVRGNVLADSIDNSITDDSLASLIRMPGGCVEQNLATITLPLIAAIYLEKTNDWEVVGVERKAEALKYIRRGYENQLVYKKSDGSYPPYRREGASTWITAYVVKVFSMAHSVVGVDTQQVCDPLSFLVRHKLKLPGGRFVEDNPVYSTTMTGGMRGDDPEITLTAFVLIALAEAKQAGIRCSQQKLEEAIDSTAEFLENALETSGRRPYTVAIASYALALAGKGSAAYDPTLQLLAASPDGSHWPDAHNHLFSLEATGYALLALVKVGQMQEAAKAFQWINGQRRIGGGYGSTQATMVVLQALSEYLMKSRVAGDLSLDVDVKITGRRDVRYHFNARTAYAAHSSRLPANLDLTVEATGRGQGILEVVTYYNQLHEVDEKTPCRHFELSVDMEESSEKPPAEVEKSYLMTIKVRALGSSDIRMAVLDISLPTGFTPETSDLELLSNSVDRYINNFKMVDNLSDRGSFIIHLFKVSHKEPEILIFRLQQNFKVGLLQPSSVTAYEYYNPDNRCSKTYTPPRDQGDLTHICKENICRCTQGDCCVAKADGESFAAKEREAFACKSLHHVFQAKVVSIQQSYYDKYEMEITRVIKLGVEAGVKAGQTRTFVSHGGCREGLDLKVGSHYLLIGPKEDQWDVDTDNNRFVYTLGSGTWVERWPSPVECAGGILRDKCANLAAAATELSLNACRL